MECTVKLYSTPTRVARYQRRPEFQMHRVACWFGKKVEPGEGIEVNRVTSLGSTSRFIPHFDDIYGIEDCSSKDE
jgi:hypothetical protein